MSALPSADASPYYVTLNAGLSKLNTFCSNSTAEFNCQDKASAYGIDAGYQYNDSYGLEFGYTNYGKAQTNGMLFGSNLEVKQGITAFKFSGTANFPLTSAFAFTGKLGMALADSSVSSTVTPGPIIPGYTASSTTIFYGIGARYRINKIIGLHAQYENLAKVGDSAIGTDTLFLLSAGISFHFDIPKSPASAGASLNNAEIKPTRSIASRPAMRIVITFDMAPPDNKQKLTSAIATACKCEPIFVRLYSTSSIIYQINPASDETFTSFENSLRKGDLSPGIKSITQYQSL